MKNKLLLFIIATSCLFACENNSISDTSSNSNSIESTTSVDESESITTSIDNPSSYSISTFTIYYDLGECLDASITSFTQEVKYGESYSLYVPSHQDYTFEYWLKKNSDEKFFAGIYNYNEDTYLVAKWKKNSTDSGWTD